MFTTLIKHEDSLCGDCGRPEEGYFGAPYVVQRKKRREVHVYSLCKICFEVDAACAEAEANDVRFTAIGTGVDGIASPQGNRCACGAVMHAMLGYCIQCSKDYRMLSARQAEYKFINKLLKELRAEIKSKAKELSNAN